MINALVGSTAVVLAIALAGPVSAAGPAQQAGSDQQAAASQDKPESQKTERHEGPLGAGGRDTNIPIPEPNTATTRFPETTGKIDLDQPPQIGDRQEGAPEPSGQQAQTPGDDKAAPAQSGMQR
jgi:hypothetical protein